jgi:hypothetical protein
MAMEWCEGGCGNLINADTFYCSDSCKQTAHRRYRGQSQETRNQPAPARRPTPPPPPPTLPIAAAWRLLSERAADLPDDLKREVFPLETRGHAAAPKRPDLTPYPRRRLDPPPR